MKIIKPLTMTAAMLTSTTVPESIADAAAYDSGTTYALDAQCSVTTGLNVQFYRSLQAGNLNKTPASEPTWWEPSSTGYLEYSATTAYVAGDKAMMAANHMVYEAVSGKTSAVTISAASPGVVGWVYHGLAEATPITFTNSGGALPTGLVAGTTYYVKTPLADSFNLAATPGGAAINTTGGSGTHTAYTNRGISPDTDVSSATPRWIEYAATNRWKAFDKKLGDQVQKTTTMQFVITPGTVVRAISLLNIDAVSLDFTLIPTDPTINTYSKSIQLISTIGIVDALSYFFEPIHYTTEVAFTDLPLGPGVITITLTKPAGETVGLGEIVFGGVETLGLTQYNPTLSINDYGKKDTDTFGNYTILQRGYSRRMSLDMEIPSALVDTLQRTLVLIRSTPVVWIGADDPVAESSTYGESLFASMVVYGFYKSFSIVIQSYSGSACSLEIEGLT